MKDNERKLIYKAREALYRELREDYLYNLFEPGNGVAEVMDCLTTALHCIELALEDFAAPVCLPGPYELSGSPDDYADVTISAPEEEQEQ